MHNRRIGFFIGNIGPVSFPLVPQWSQALAALTFSPWEYSQSSMNILLCQPTRPRVAQAVPKSSV
jgi:hypothetical protein